MYEIRETVEGAERLVLVTDEIGEVVNHIASEGFQFVMDILGVKTFDRADGATALVRVR